MKIAGWLAMCVLVHLWAETCAKLRFVTDHSLEEIQEDEVHKLTPVVLEPISEDSSLLSSGDTWGKQYFKLLISCTHGSLVIEKAVGTNLVDTTFVCAKKSQHKRSIQALTTAIEAQHILSALIYQPDTNYHSTWYGITDPLCLGGRYDPEIVRMQLSPIRDEQRLGTQQLPKGLCRNIDEFESSLTSSPELATHEKKVSVVSVNDPPTVERREGSTLSVHAGGSCVGLSGFELGDVESIALENDPEGLVPILTLKLEIRTGILRVNRRSALMNGVHTIANAEQNTRDAPLAWTLPDLVDTTLVMKGGISDLNVTLPAVEYCSSPEKNATSPDTLNLLLSDNGVCGDNVKTVSLTIFVDILPVADLGKLLSMEENTTLTDFSASVALQYMPGDVDKVVECVIELKYENGMMLGLDGQVGTIILEPNTPILINRPKEDLLLTRGLLIQFPTGSDYDDQAKFTFARKVCGDSENCHEIESLALNEGAGDEDILTAAQSLALEEENVAELQVIRYPTSRCWIIWNGPGGFMHDLTIYTRSKIVLQKIGRSFRLEGKSRQVSMQLKTLRVYSLSGGVWSQNLLNIALSLAKVDDVHHPDILSTQIDIFGVPLYTNIGLQHPQEVNVDDTRVISLSMLSLTYPSTYAATTSLSWTIQCNYGSITWDPSLVGLSVVSQQTSPNKLDLRGNLVDLNMAIATIQIDESYAHAKFLEATVFYKNKAVGNNEEGDRGFFDSISMSVNSVDTFITFASGAIRARIPRQIRRVKIQLPVSFLRVALNKTLTIDGFGIQGYAQELSLSVSCTKGTMKFMPKRATEALLSGSIEPNSVLKVSGSFHMLTHMIYHSYLLYSPHANSSHIDELVFTVKYFGGENSVVLPIEIVAPMKPPSITLPAAAMAVFGGEYTHIEGVTLSLIQSEGLRRISRGVGIRITAQNGQVELAVSGPSQDPHRGEEVQFESGIENVNAALQGLRYQAPIQNAPADDRIVFTTYLIGENNETETSVLLIKITPRHIPIRLFLDNSVIGDGSVLPTTMNVPASLERLSLQLEGDNIQWSSCNYEDARAKTNECKISVELSIFAMHGSISTRLDLVSLETNANATNQLLFVAHFTGDIVQTNSYLQQLMYAPDPNFHGPAQIIFTVKETRRTAGTDEETMILPIFVFPACVSPQIYWTINGASTMSFSSSVRTMIALPELLLVRGGLENGYCQDDVTFRVIFQATYGFFSFTSSDLAPVIALLSNDHRVLTLEGRIWNLNLAFEFVGFQFEIRGGGPTTTIVDLRVYENADHHREMFEAVSSASLRLNFIGDDRPLNFLEQETIITLEDEDTLIGGAINLAAIADITSHEVISIKVHNGVVYSNTVDGPSISISSAYQLRGSIHHLQQLMMSLRYVPNTDFNGIDAINFNVQDQGYTLYIYVQADNDPPKFVFSSYDMKDWYNYPRMFLPSFKLDDPDKSDMFEVDIRVDQGSLFVDQLTGSDFDGTTVEFNSSTSLRIMSTLDNLNKIFLKRMIEVLPWSCSNAERLKISCAAEIELCAYDGADRVCTKLSIPQLYPFYRVAVLDGIRTLNISAGNSLNISNTFTVYERFKIQYELMARVHVLSGFVRIGVPSCGELRDVVDAADLKFNRMSQIFYAPDATCMNQALASMHVQSLQHVRTSIVIALELFSKENRLLSNNSISIQIVGDAAPEQNTSIQKLQNEWEDPNMPGSENLPLLGDSIRRNDKNVVSVDLPSRTSHQPRQLVFAPNSSNPVIKIYKTGVQPIGDILSVSDDQGDSNWFRLRAKASHGTLYIPTTICCVDIRDTKRENELDIVGTAWTLKRAIAAAEFQGAKLPTGNNSLMVTVSPFISKLSVASITFTVPIEITGIATNISPPIVHQAYESGNELVEVRIEANGSDLINPPRPERIDIDDTDLESLLSLEHIDISTLQSRSCVDACDHYYTITPTAHNHEKFPFEFTQEDQSNNSQALRDLNPWTPQPEHMYRNTEDVAYQFPAISLLFTGIMDDPASMSPTHYFRGHLPLLWLKCSPLVVNEDTPRALDGLSVCATDMALNQLLMPSLLMVATLSVSHGIISLGDTSNTNCISEFMGQQSWKHVSFKAELICINKVLAGATYAGEPNFSGTDSLQFRVEYDQSSDSVFDKIIVPIVVVELNDAPWLDVASEFYDAEEDYPLVLKDLRLQDPDALDKPLLIAIEANYGQLALLRSTGVKLTTEKVSRGIYEATKLTIEGTLNNLNVAINSIVYTSAKDWNSLQLHSDGGPTGMNGFDSVTIYSTDFSPFNASSTVVLYIYVEPTPDLVAINPPSNAATSVYARDSPGTLRGDEDSWIEMNDLAFFSADDTSRTTLLVSLSVSHGILALSSLHGLTFLEKTADKRGVMKIKGTFANVNACVTGLRYIPDENFYGGDALTIDASAVDEYTLQATPLNTINVAIMIDAVNDAPIWNIGSSTVRQIQQNRAASMAGVSFHDVDILGIDCEVKVCLMDLIVEASHGLVTLSQPTPSFSNDFTTKKVAYMVLSATPQGLNSMLSKLIFELDSPEYYRADAPVRTDISVQLSVDDRGTFGLGGPQISTTTLVFSPVVWSHYSLSILAPEKVLTLTEDTAFKFNDGELQLIGSDSSRSFQNLIEVTIICGSGTFSLSSTATGVQVLRNDSNGEIVVRGFISQLNSGLNGSLYMPTANWYGSEQILLTAVELNHYEKSKDVIAASIYLFVEPACDEPRWVDMQQLDEPLSVQEDGFLLINALSLANPDLDDAQREVDITITVNHGGVMLSITTGLLIQQAVYSTSAATLAAHHVPQVRNIQPESRLFFGLLQLRGKISDINAALGGMIFKPWLDYTSDGWPVSEIELVAVSACGHMGVSSAALSSPAAISIPIAVSAINDAPILLSQSFQPLPISYSLRDLEVFGLSSSIEATEDSPQQLEPAELYDADYALRNGDLRLLVNISCVHCTITSPIQDQDQVGDDLIILSTNWGKDEGVQMVVHGNLPSLNTGLMNQLVFQGTRNFNGLAFVVIELSDLGGYGEGGEQHTAFVLCVQVKTVNDAPQVLLPQYQSQQPLLQLDEGSSMLIQGAPALSTIAPMTIPQKPTWDIVAASLFASDSSTRLHSLKQFSGAEGLVASFLVEYNGGLLFSGRDPIQGQELWYSDGTADGSMLLKDIFPGNGDSWPSYLTPFSKDNRVYFSAEGPQLSWLVKGDYQDACQSFRPSSLDSNVFFAVAEQNVWDPNETYDCPLGYRWMSTAEAQEVFVGTIELEGHSEEPLTYFDQCGWRGYEWGGQTRKYFRFSDSKTTGAYKHAGFRDSYRLNTGFQTNLFAGIVCYRGPAGYQAKWGTQLWATDGTAEGTLRVARISTEPQGSSPSHFVEFNQRLYFQARSPDFGAELWTTDGTRDGTLQVADIEFGSRSSGPQFLTVFDARVFFSAYTGAYGRELWFSNGESYLDFTEDRHAMVGTGLLLDICVGAKSSSPQQFAALSPSTGMPLLLFQADDCIHGIELWATDGTKTGTSLVLDIRQGTVGSSPSYLTSFAGQVFFQADDGIHGAELWVTNGFTSGTTMLVDIAPGALGSKPCHLTVLNRMNTPSAVLVFAAQSDIHVEFWQSDGTVAGTTKVYSQSPEVVRLNDDALNVQLAAHTLVSIPSDSAGFFYLGRAHDSNLPIVKNTQDSPHTRSITLQDVESTRLKRDLTLSLSCSKGWLSLVRDCTGVSFKTGDNTNENHLRALTLTGSLDALNCAVEKVVYHSDHQVSGLDNIYVSVTQSVLDTRNEYNNAAKLEDARDSSYAVSKSMLVEIRAVNDPPSITMGLIYYAPRRQWVALSGIDITDPDSADGILFVSISVLNGRLRVTQPPINGPTVLHSTINGGSSRTLEFAATVAQAKAICKTLEYSCNDRDGCTNTQREYVTVQAEDNGFTGAGGPQMATKRAEIVVLEPAA